MTDSRDYDAEQEVPIIRDKRRVDPATGERRVPDADPAGAAPPAGPGGGAAPEGASPSGTDELEAARAEALDLADQLARTKAEVYNTEQRFNAFVKRTRAEAAAAREEGRNDVVEALVPVLDDVTLARQHGELAGPFAAIAEKLEQVLAARFEVERFGAEGEEFDPAVHEAIMHTTDPAASASTVQMVAQPGYRRGEQVIRPARVGVVGPE